MLAAADQNGFTYVWNMSTKQPAYGPLQDLQTDGGVESVAFSPNGQLVVTGDGNGYVNVWNPDTGKFDNAPGDSGAMAITALAFSPDSNTLITGDSNGTIAFWPTDSMQDSGTGQHLDPAGRGRRNDPVES
jgi:WD40 repeat protein